MINNILATDMGVHFKYMQEMGDLQAKFEHNSFCLDGWSVKVLEGYRDLICGLLIKCADISNVVSATCLDQDHMYVFTNCTVHIGT